MIKGFIQVASWEDRFLAGLQAALSNGPIAEVICFASNRYQERTEKNCNVLARLSAENGSNLKLRKFDFGDVIQVHNAMHMCVTDLLSSKIDEVILDISTAPRHIVWGLLSVFSENFTRVALQYVKAKGYGSWQTDEDQDPRLVLNCSGVMYPDLPTCLIMMCGPEVSRAEKMFYKFEPRRTFILRDVDASSHGKIKKFDYSERANVTEIAFDSKDLSDKNFSILCDLVQPLIDKYNVVCSSFGPKLGSILLFKLIQKFPEIALSYVPAGVHNPELSIGSSTIMNFSIGLKSQVDR
jgi:hypothetical protein